MSSAGKEAEGSVEFEAGTTGSSATGSCTTAGCGSDSVFATNSDGCGDAWSTGSTLSAAEVSGDSVVSETSVCALLINVSCSRRTACFFFLPSLTRLDFLSRLRCFGSGGVPVNFVLILSYSVIKLACNSVSMLVCSEI